MNRNAAAQNNLGLSYYESGQFARALECFDLALGVDTKNAMYVFIRNPSSTMLSYLLSTFKLLGSNCLVKCLLIEFIMLQGYSCS